MALATKDRENKNECTRNKDVGRKFNPPAEGPYTSIQIKWNSSNPTMQLAGKYFHKKD